MAYDNWKTTEPDPWEHDEEFCLIHGYEFMRRDLGNPIARCSQCEREARDFERALEADGEKLRQLTGEDHGPFEIESS
jgi:hypothetical protein